MAYITHNPQQDQIIPNDLIDVFRLLTHFDLIDFIEWMGNWAVSRGLCYAIIYFSLLGILWVEMPGLPVFAFGWILGTLPVWLPLSLAIGGYKVWIWYARALYIASRHKDAVLLEIRIPRDLVKSPRAMEAVFPQLHSTSGETTFYHRQWKGQARPYFSFEIASFAGEIHFYAWCWRNQRHLVESAIYGQYPEVEIFEVEDYASKFQYDPKKHMCYCNDYRFEPMRDRIDAYPIRTYIEYELDKDPKEEYKIDPLSQILE